MFLIFKWIMTQYHQTFTMYGVLVFNNHIQYNWPQLASYATDLFPQPCIYNKLFSNEGMV